MENTTNEIKLDWLVEYKDKDGETNLDKYEGYTEEGILNVLKELNNAGNKVKNYSVII